MIDDAQRVIPGRAAIQGLQLLESCAYTWIFDAATLLFRKIPRDARVAFGVPAGWTPYHRLEIDDSRSCFVVALDTDGTRVLRAWLHVDPCGRCSPPWRPLGESKQSILWWKDALNVVDRRSVARLRGNHLLRPFGGWLRPDGAS
jgi:hypothetical protein